MNRVRLVLVAGLGVTVLAVGIAVLPPGTPETSQTPETVELAGSELIEPVPNRSKLWPYTSRSRSVEGRTLGINLILVGDQTAVEQFFRREATGNWTRRPHPAEARDGGADVLPIEPTGPAWGEGYASTRYTLIVPAGREESLWVEETYELFDGAYLGDRYHIRAYAPPGEEKWTALQAHREYWDWFRLRHTVTSVATARLYIEDDLRATAPIEGMTVRQRGGPGPLDSSGWVTIVEFLAVLVLLGTLRESRGKSGCLQSRFEGVWSNVRGGHPGRRIGLLGGLPVLYIGIRLGAIGFESVLVTITPKVIVAVLYPVLVVGTPLLADRFSRPLGAATAFLFATAGLMLAFLLDFAVLGLSTVPLGLLLHRVSQVLSIGLVAAGAAIAARGDRWNVVRVLGLVGWVLGLAFGLVGIA